MRGRRSVRTFGGREPDAADLGIALCHLALAAKESGIDVHFHRADPGIPAPADTEYIASYLFV